MKATRVFLERVEPDDQNEKYLAHVWLQRLGYHGTDFKAERKILLGHMKGYPFTSKPASSSHRNGQPVHIDAGHSFTSTRVNRMGDRPFNIEK